MGGDRGKCQPIKGARAAWLQLDAGPPDLGPVSGGARGGPHLTAQGRTEGSWGRRHTGLSQGDSHLPGGLCTVSELGPLSKQKTLSSHRGLSPRGSRGSLYAASTLSSRLCSSLCPPSVVSDSSLPGTPLRFC